MKVIYKYKMPVIGNIMAPVGQVRLVAYESDSSELPTIWIEHDPVIPGIQVTSYFIVGTGQEFEPTDTEHVGSAKCGRFVWHVYRHVS